MIKVFKLNVILTLSVVFALGAIVGGSWQAIVISRKPGFALPLQGQGQSRFVERCKSRLQLTSQQTQRLESILDEAQSEFRRLHLAVKPRFEAIRQSMRSGIRQMLNEAQKREYETMLRERDQQNKRRPPNRIR